jgi:hypothetical protein
MILNDKPNCQVSRILMNPRPIVSDYSENDPVNKLSFIFFFIFLFVPILAKVATQCVDEKSERNL